MTLRSLLAACVMVSGAAAHGDALITALQTDQARYAPGAPVVVSITVANTTGRLLSGGSVRLTAWRLDTPMPGPAAQPFRLGPGAARTLRFSWRPPRTDNQGYVLQARALSASGGVLDSRTTAADVSSHWAKFLRYGYVSAFPAQPSAASRETVRRLAEFHVNALQFYDWQFKHHAPLAGTVAHPVDSWKDLANRPTARRTVRDLIDAAHGFGMAAMNYNLLYGAWSGYGDDGVDYRWGLWRKKDGTDQYRLPMPGGWATPALYVFNPADPGWQRYLIAQESGVFAAYPFDGWQVDQVGDPGAAVYDIAGKPVDVWTTFRPFLNAARAGLDRPLVFNNVGGYGLYDTAAHADTAAVYVECWPFAGQTTYSDLKTVIEQASSWSGGKAVALAAYMDYEHSKSSGGHGTFSTPGVLLTDATIFASGGSHIELGDGARMLSSEYFPNRNLAVSPALRDALRGYYDFLVGYENLLRDGLGQSRGAISLSVPSSADAAPGAVWAFAKSGGGRHVLHLINLIGEKSNAWRDDNGDYPAPTAQSSIVVTYHCGPGKVRRVDWASPDAPDIALRPLPFTTGTDGGGAFVRFTVPELDYWDVVSLTVVPETPSMRRTRL